MQSLLRLGIMINELYRGSSTIEELKTLKLLL